jgi:hypothetical protein
MFSQIYNSCLLASLFTACLAFIIHFVTPDKISLGSVTTGYVILIISILMILIKLTDGLLNTTNTNSSTQRLLSIIMTISPFLLLLIVISFILFTIINHYQNIALGHVSQGYYTFSNISIILIIIQIGIIYRILNSLNYIQTGEVSKVSSSLILLLGTLTSISSIILYIILTFFTTDG